MQIPSGETREQISQSAKQGNKPPYFCIFYTSNNLGMIFTMTSTRLLEETEVQAGLEWEAANPKEGDS